MQAGASHIPMDRDDFGKEPRSLKKNVLELEKENSELRELCRNLSQTVEGLEMVLGETNQRLLEGEILAMELGQLFSSSSEATWVVRDDNLVVRANEAMLKFLDKGEEEVIGQQIPDLLDGVLDPEASVQLFSMLKSRKACEFDIERQLPGWEKEYFILSTRPLVTIDGSPGVAVQFKDISARKRAEIALAKAKEEVERLACTDGLTELFNRRAFDETMAREWKRMLRGGSPLSLVLGDIDFFKKYNYHYGHQEGDDCLRHVARALATGIRRPGDLAARYGGEEFVLLLPDTPAEGAKIVAENVHRAVEELKLPHAASEVAPHVTLSLGIASLIPTAENQPQDLVRAADEALYLAKKQGRNRFACK